jgi:hypothetical protein
MLHHASDEGIDSDGLPFYPLRLMGTIMIGNPFSLVVIDVLEQDRRTHDIYLASYYVAKL